MILVTKFIFTDAEEFSKWVKAGHYGESRMKGRVVVVVYRNGDVKISSF